MFLCTRVARQSCLGAGGLQDCSALPLLRADRRTERATARSSDGDGGARAATCRRRPGRLDVVQVRLARRHEPSRCSRSRRRSRRSRSADGQILVPEDAGGLYARAPPSPSSSTGRPDRGNELTSNAPAATSCENVALAAANRALARPIASRRRLPGSHRRARSSSSPTSSGKGHGGAGLRAPLLPCLRRGGDGRDRGARSARHRRGERVATRSSSQLPRRTLTSTRAIPLPDGFRRGDHARARALRTPTPERRAPRARRPRFSTFARSERTVAETELVLPPGQWDQRPIDAAASRRQLQVMRSCGCALDRSVAGHPDRRRDPRTLPGDAIEAGRDRRHETR